MYVFICYTLITGIFGLSPWKPINNTFGETEEQITSRLDEYVATCIYIILHGIFGAPETSALIYRPLFLLFVFCFCSRYTVLFCISTWLSIGAMVVARPSTSSSSSFADDGCYWRWRCTFNTMPMQAIVLLQHRHWIQRHSRWARRPMIWLENGVRALLLAECSCAPRDSCSSGSAGGGEKR